MRDKWPSASGSRRRRESSSRRTSAVSPFGWPTSRSRKPSSSKRASSSAGRGTRASAGWRSAPTPTGTPSSCTGGMRRMSRAEALERYSSLPVPDTAEEHWRFTNLRGFDPDSYGHDESQTPAVTVPSMLELDVAAEAVVTETGIEITRAPAEIRFEPLDESHERLGSLVGWQDDKFTAHKAAAWQNGLHVHEPRGLALDLPLYERVTYAIYLAPAYL